MTAVGAPTSELTPSGVMYRPDAPLEHGWSTTTPIDDSIMRRAVLALAETTALPSEAMGARVLRTGEVVATDLDRAAGYWNAATVLRPLSESGWHRLLDELELFSPERDPRRAIALWSPFPTPDLGSRGWELSGHPPAMWMAAGTERPPTPRGFEVEVVRDRAGVETWASAATEWFPLPAAAPDIATIELLERSDIRLLIGRAGGRPVSLGSTVIAHGTNAVPLIACDPEARGRGYGTAITWAASRIGPDLPAVLLASDAGRPVYERMGYEALHRWTVWIRPSDE